MSQQLLALTAADTLVDNVLTIHSVTLAAGERATLVYVADNGDVVPLTTWQGAAVDAYTKAQMDVLLATVATTLPLATTRTADYTLALADAGSLVPVASSNAVAVTFPAHATVALPVGSFGYVRRTATGAVSVLAAAGVQLLPPGAGTTLDSYGELSWHKIDLNTYWLKGDLL